MFTISAQNRRLPLSGNNIHIILLTALGISAASCGLFGPVRQAPEQTPKEKPAVVITDNTPVVAGDTSKVRKNDTVQIASSKKGKLWVKKEKYNLVYALPFSTDESELEKLMLEENITGYQPLASIEFYEGARMALDTLDSLGIHLDVSVFNHYKDSSLTAALFSKPQIRNADVVIGPVFNEGLKAAANVALQQEFFLISPLSPNHNFTDSNRYFMMANPPAVDQMQQLLQYVADSVTNATIICISRTDKPAEAKLAAEFQEAFARTKHGVQMQIRTADNYTKAAEQMSAGANFVFIASFDELFTNGLVRDLSKLSREQNITLLGLPHQLSFESISIDYFENLKFTYPTAYYADRNDPKVERFSAVFSEKYKTRPSDFAMRGYDLTLYVGLMLQQYRPDLAGSEGKLNRYQSLLLYPYRFAVQNDINNNPDHYNNSTIAILQYSGYHFNRVR